MNRSYGLKTAKYVDYCATIRTNSGGSVWEYIRVSFGDKAAYASIARHWEGEGKITSFRHGDSLTAYDREGIAQGNPGLITNVWAGYGEMKAYA